MLWKKFADTTVISMLYWAYVVNIQPKMIPLYAQLMTSTAFTTSFLKTQVIHATMLKMEPWWRSLLSPVKHIIIPFLCYSQARARQKMQRHCRIGLVFLCMHISITRMERPFMVRSIRFQLTASLRSGRCDLVCVFQKTSTETRRSVKLPTTCPE